MDGLVLVPPAFLGGVALLMGLRGRVRGFVSFVPVALGTAALLIWQAFGLSPIYASVIMAMLSLGLFLCACFGVGLLVHRVREGRA